MCGICGKFNFDRERHVDPGILRRMLDTIRHRGPDGSGYYLSGPVGLGHRRLSIIDLESGDQPMSNEDGSIWTVYNGEIYNFAELRAELKGRGHRFTSRSDTEVIVHLYEELGDECVTKFNGMFAFALWDERRQRLLLARDRLGIKPLYLRRSGQGITFASEVKALLVDPEAGPVQLNSRAVDRFLSFYYLPGEETLFQGIVKLQPGHCLSVSADRWALSQYWDLSFDPDPHPQSYEDAVAEVEARLRGSVSAHMISDVPVGVLLSGGVDSSGILSYATRQSGPVHSFTMGFDGGAFADERPYARLAADKFGSVHHDISLTAREFAEFLPRYVWHMEEPVCEPPAVALYFVAALARRTGVKVLLSGEGGDEAFGGYPEYRNLLWLERLKSALGPARGLLPLGFELLSRMGWSRGGHYAELSGRPLEDYYYSRTASPASPFSRLKPGIYGSEFAARVAPGSAADSTAALWSRSRHWPILHRMLYVDSKTWLPDDLLVKADKMTMAASVELRVPLLDHTLLEFAASLPAHYKVSGHRLKRVLKAALKGNVPPEIIERKKTGFPVPYETCMRGELKELVADSILSAGSFAGACFTRRVVSKLIDDFGRGRRCSKEVFSLLVMEHWYQQFMGRVGLEASAVGSESVSHRAAAPNGAAVLGHVQTQP